MSPYVVRGHGRSDWYKPVYLIKRLDHMVAALHSTDSVLGIAEQCDHIINATLDLIVTLDGQSEEFRRCAYDFIVKAHTTAEFARRLLQQRQRA